MTQAFIGLGSNLDQPRQQLQQALEDIAQIPQTHLIQASPFYGSHAIGPGVQPDYINAAAHIETQLDADSLLSALQRIEQQHGRQRGSERWTARTLDLDLLLYGTDIIDTPSLQVPHPRLHERNFVLQPLADLDPELKLPNGQPIKTLLSRVSQDGLWRLPE